MLALTQPSLADRSVGATRSYGPAQQSADGKRAIGGDDQRFADEDGVDTGRSEPFDITAVVDTALAHQDGSQWCLRGQTFTHCQIDLEGPQVAIVDADEESA